MKNKLAKLKYLPNNFNIIEEGDHVICAISGKKILLEKIGSETIFGILQIIQNSKKITPIGSRTIIQKKLLKN